MQSFFEFYGLRNLISDPTCYRDPDYPDLSELSMENISNTSNVLKNVLQICIGVLDKLALQKKKNMGNNIPFMNKPLARAHMKRTRLRSRFLKNRSEVKRINFIKQRHYCEVF